MSILSLDKVDAGYGEAWILHQVSLAIEAGERVAILGRNGVGKTTIVNTCLGIARIRSGTVSFHGQVQHRLRHFSAARVGIAVVPQGRQIVPGLTVRENLILGAAANRSGKWNFDAVCELFPILKERAEV